MQISGQPQFDHTQRDQPQAGHAGTEAMSAPVIDRECMAEMWDDAGPALFQRMAKLFEGEWRRYVAQLHDALQTGDRESLKREAHSLKSAAAYICAESLRLASLSLERAAPAAEPAALARLADVVAAEAEVADIELARAIAERTGGD
jgi:HPt (histidine-containing phosphotransfer) domain-containing protein